MFPPGASDRLRGIGGVLLELISLPKYISVWAVHAHRVQYNSHTHAQPAASRFLVKDQLADETGRGIRFRHDTHFFGTMPSPPPSPGANVPSGQSIK